MFDLKKNWNDISSKTAHINDKYQTRQCSLHRWLHIIETLSVELILCNIFLVVIYISSLQDLL